LAVAARALQSLAPDERDAQDEISTFKPPSVEALFVNFVSFVDPFDISSVARPVTWACDGQNFDGISDQLLVMLRVRAATGDAQAAKEAIELADYLASCDRGEVRWSAHAIDEELARWNRQCSDASFKKRRN